MVTAPIHKAVLNERGLSAFPAIPNSWRFLTRRRRAVMMLASEKLRVVPLTIHMPLAEVPGAISEHAILETAEIILTALTRDFGLPIRGWPWPGSIPMPAKTACWACEEKNVDRAGGRGAEGARPCGEGPLVRRHAVP